MTTIDTQKHTYMPGLDGLRALAVFAVIAYHLNLPFAPGGFLGVTLFFVLSGYLITDLLITEWTLQEKINLKSFFMRRGKRLLPSVFFVLICLSAYISVFRPELLSNLKSEILPAAFSFSNWWFIFNKIPYFSSSPSLLNHFWSLAVEVQFYIVWPFVMLFLLRFIKTKWVKIMITVIAALASAALMGALFVPGGDPSRIYYGTDTRVFSLLLGAGLAFVYPSLKAATAAWKQRTRIIFELGGLIALASILFMTYYITQYDDFLYRGGMLVFSFASALLVAGAANPRTVIGKIFSTRPLRFIGKISYGVYLWQLPVIVLTNTAFASNRMNTALVVFQVAVTILMATVSYYLIENPVRRNNILGYLRHISFRDFCAGCMRTRWWEKTAALFVLALVLISSIGFFNAQAVPNSPPDELSALPSQIIITPSDSPDVSTSQPIASPSPDVSPSPAPPSSSPTAGAQAPDETPASSPDASQPPQSSSLPDIVPSNLKITVIGDSVAIDVLPYLQAYYPKMYLDAEVGRQFYQAKTIVTALLEKNELGPTVVIELGSNGAFSEAQMRALIELIGSTRKIVFVNTQVPRTWCLTVNDMLSKISAEYSNTAVADWYSASLDQSDYFYKDGFHPNKTGSPVLAGIIADAISDIQDPIRPNRAID